MASLVSFRTVVVWDFSFPPIPEYFLYPVVIKRKCLGSNNSQLCVEGLGSCCTPAGSLGAGDKENWPFLCKAAFLGSCRDLLIHQGVHEAREPHQRAQPVTSSLSHCSQGAEGRERARVQFSLFIS